MRLAKRGTIVASVLLLAAPYFVQSSQPLHGQIEFFEKKVRPVLAERCFACHSAQVEVPMGGLSLDSRESLLKGGSRGSTVVPGDPEKSRLIQAIRYADKDLQMPPEKPLAAEQVADLEAWVKMGVPFPLDKPAAPDKRAPGAHWAFQPVGDPALPIVKFKKWPRNPIDFFILARLEIKGLRPAPPASKWALIRRATFDLTGLPPPPQDVEAFQTDNSPDAFARVVDRLLASPRYGERWGRHWLDVARYADTKGYVFTQEPRFAYSYTYRDWVIRAFNEDLPYDQFLIQQIAADLLPLGDDKTPLAAMGFLTLGRRFLNNVHDVIDDRIDVLTRGTMGLTVACARCHDHKYDPIPTKDYYSLYGVLASSREPKELPQISVAAQPQSVAAYEKELRPLAQEVRAFLESKHKELLPELRTAARTTEYLLAAQEALALPDDELRPLAEKRSLNAFVLQRWRDFFKRTGGSGDHPIFGLWHAYAALAGDEFARQAAGLAEQVPARKQVNSVMAAEFSAKPPLSMREVAERYAAVLVRFDQRAVLVEADQEALRQVLNAPDAPPNVAAGDVERLFNRADRDKLTRLRKKIDQLTATHPGAPPRAMSLEDAPEPEKARVFIRGNPKNPGEEVPRQFLALLSGRERRPFQHGSGRLELARAIAGADNPLTARVLVNRVWMHHFGAGLVRTPSDFGTRSDPPTHPELLDYLARGFIADGWSIKKLHRLILLSSSYQQSSQAYPHSYRLDPENLLWSRMNRRKLDFEAMRDSLLFVSGRLDPTMGGRAVDLAAQPFARRRTVYGFIDRLNLPNMFRIFDFANPDLHSPQRYSTTVPQQALFMMNSPFAIEQAAHLVRRCEAGGEDLPERRIQRLYQLVYGRAAAPPEVSLGLRFLESEQAQPAEPPAEKPSVWQYGFGHFDEATGQVANFEPFTHFTGDAWQGGAQLPAAETGLAALRADGGHPGNDTRHAVMRRWVAPHDGIAGIRGTIVHRQSDGDGIQARIVSSRVGPLANWTVRRLEAEAKMDGLEVKQGDTIDFVVDCRANSDSDAFRWSPVIRLARPAMAGQAAEEPEEWNAAGDFKGPPGRPLTAWEKYAQILLLANEFMFVD